MTRSQRLRRTLADLAAAVILLPAALIVTAAIGLGLLLDAWLGEEH